jgi:ABC-2 type transport system permease protein
MMSRGLKSVLKMHIKQQMLSKAFIWSTLLLPVLMFVVVMIQTALANLDSIEKSHVIVASTDAQLLDALQPEFAEREEVASGTYTLEYQQVNEADLDEYVAVKRELIMADSNNGLFYIPAAALTDKRITFYSTNVGNQVLRQNITPVISETLNRLYFSDRAIAQADIDYVVKPLDVRGLRVSESGEQTGSAGNYIVGFGLAILLMISMIGIVSPFSAMVIEEKTNRAVEVLLTSVSPKELLAGKIMARTITGMAQMLIWLTPLFLLMLSPTMLLIPDNLRPDVGIGTVLFFVVNYVFGVTIMLAIWGGFSAMFDSTQDAANSMWPLMMLMWVPFYAVFALLNNPANGVATILSIAPFTSLYVMPFRMALVEVPIWQPLLALLINAAILYGAVVAGGKIYRISVLATGQQPSMKQFMTWLRQPG